MNTFLIFTLSYAAIGLLIAHRVLGILDEANLVDAPEGTRMFVFGYMTIFWPTFVYFRIVEQFRR